MINISIVGATGYTGEELIKILLRHPRVRLAHVTSEGSAGQKVSDVHPEFRGRCDWVLEKYDAARLAKDSDVGFFALPHGAAAKAVADFRKRGKKAVDLSADFRLEDEDVYRKWYKTEHAAPALLKKAVYGLPELFRDEIRGAELVANPGCYATTCILALAPLLRAGAVRPDSIVVDAKSGVTGAGKKPAAMYHYPEVSENFQAYAVAEHRHMPEVEQILSRASGKKVRMTFVPHLLPMNRGILASAYGTLAKKLDTAGARKIFQRAYEGERFVRLLPEGVWPQTRAVARTNFCDVNVKVDERNGRVVVLAALDNLVKGAAGQAVQNMNLLFGFEESEGLL
jgi:N-acetyl-gamma-glutamyl-phosphate reductase